MIYLDSDGIFSNWQKHVLFKHLPRYNVGSIKEMNKMDSSKRSEMFKDIYSRDPHLFYKLDVIPQSVMLLDYVIDNNLDWKILTATTNTEWLNFNIAKDDKLAWWKEHFNVEPSKIIVVGSSEDKLRYCNPGDILIDDFDVTCNTWQERGGIAINPESNIYDINAVLKELKQYTS